MGGGWDNWVGGGPGTGHEEGYFASGTVSGTNYLTLF